MKVKKYFVQCTVCMKGINNSHKIFIPGTSVKTCNTNQFVMKPVCLVYTTQELNAPSNLKKVLCKLVKTFLKKTSKTYFALYFCIEE